MAMRQSERVREREEKRRGANLIEISCNPNAALTQNGQTLSNGMQWNGGDDDEMVIKLNKKSAQPKSSAVPRAPFRSQS